MMTARAPNPTQAPRRAYIDWLRGVAVVLMVLWHAVDAWLAPGHRATTGFGIVGFLAGWAAPMFLFFAGMSQPMAGASRMARGVSRQRASQLLIRRGFQVFIVAHLFRLQSFVLNPNAGWDTLFKPDILNVLGLGLVMTGFAWRYATTRSARVGWLLLPAVFVAGVLTPWIPSWTWPSLIHPRLEGYIRVANGNAVFSLFPAVAYVFAGAFVGTALAARTAGEERPFQLRTAGVGVLLLAAAQGSSFVTVSPGISWWTATLFAVGGRVGTILLLVAATWWLLRSWPPARWSPMMVFGHTSMFVYWVHIELVYGRFSYPIQRSLPLPTALAAYGVLMLALYGAARLWLRRPAGAPLIPPHMYASRPAT